MITRGTVVTAATVFAVRTDTGDEHVPAELRYDAADPYAVTVAFQVGPDRWLDWVFGRDLLAAGLAGAAGDGDVRIRRDPGDPATVVFDLESSSGHATIEGVAADLMAFVGRSYAMVGPGTEGRFLNLDETVDLLLSFDPR